MSYFDAGAAVLIFAILVYAHIYLATEPLELLNRFFEEFIELTDGHLGQTGAINALGLVVVGAFGFLIFFEQVLGSLLAKATSLVDHQHAQEYAASVRLDTLFFALAAFAALSTLLTMLGERQH